MRPLNSKYFGQNGIQINFWNGSSSITGYIVKQTGANRYVVTDDSNTYNDTVILQEATPTAFGQGQIVVNTFGGGHEHAYSVAAHLVKTFEDHVYAWTLGGSPADAQHATLIQNS